MKFVMQCLILFVLSLLLVTSTLADEPARLIQPDRDRDKLLKRLGDENPKTVSNALNDLKFASRGRKRLFKPRLFELVDSPRRDLRQSAIELLADVGPDASDAMPALQAQLTHTSPEIRFAAADAVWRVGGRADLAAQLLIAELKNPTRGKDESHDQWLRESASWHLQRMGPAAAVSLDSLIGLMDDPREVVRREVTKVLGTLGPQYREPVEKRSAAALDDPASPVRLAAAIGMGQIDASLDRAVQVLIELAKVELPPSEQTADNPWGPSYLPSSAVEALGKLESDASPAVMPLSELLKSHVLAIRLEAATALGRIGPEAKEAVPELSRALQETKTYGMPFAHRSWCVGDNAAEALERIGVAAAPELIAALENNDRMVRARASKALGGIQEAALISVGPLSKRFEDSEPYVRIEAAKALENLGTLAVDAAPQLAKLLLDDQGVTFFRGGLGAAMGISDSPGRAALRALASIKPKAEHVVPPLVEAIKETDYISYEAIGALRQFPAEATAAKESIELLLRREDTRVAAACALAFIAPDHDEIQPILERAVFEGENPRPFAPLGLSQLAATGRKFDEAFAARVFTLAEKHHNILLWQCVFRLMPQDERATESFVSAIQNAHSTLEAASLREAEKTVFELISSHPRLRQEFLRELEYVADFFEEEKEYYRAYDQSKRRTQAAKILIAARVEVERAISCLSQLVDDDHSSAASEIAEFLSEDASPPREAIPLLMTLIEIDGLGDLAAKALITLKAKDTLIGKINSENADVRVRVARALGQFDGESVIGALLSRTNDLDYRIRRETVVALGRIGKAHPEVRVRLRGILRASESDRRRSVRIAAAQAITDWSDKP